MNRLRIDFAFQRHALHSHPHFPDLHHGHRH